MSKFPPTSSKAWCHVGIRNWLAVVHQNLKRFVCRLQSRVSWLCQTCRKVRILMKEWRGNVRIPWRKSQSIHIIFACIRQPLYVPLTVSEPTLDHLVEKFGATLKRLLVNDFHDVESLMGNLPVAMIDTFKTGQPIRWWDWWKSQHLYRVWFRVFLSRWIHLICTLNMN